ncbi:MAG TPA: hypothetical protein VEN99_04615 [Acidimicrobiia bacterium]|nr:hypothetical protein [Acidimicrobiia bacterium]
MARPRWAALAVLATMTLAACTAGGKAPTTAKGQVEQTTSPTVRVKAARSSQELSRALAITVPDGYVRQPDNVDDTGPSDLDKAVSDDGGNDARDIFTRDHFVRGYQREWVRDGGKDEIVSYVYQFADNAGAVDYTNRVAADAGAPAGQFTVPDIAGAVGVNGSDPNFATSSVTFVKGPYSVQVVVNGASPDGLSALVTSVAEEQYSRL